MRRQLVKLREASCASSRSLKLHVLIFLLLAVFSGCGRETHFPDRPITLICPWSAGGGTDRVSRQVAAQLEEVLGTPVNVINATGGSGVTGHTRGALARPDGYTLTMVTVELNMLHWRGLTSLTYQDFAPIQLLNRDAAAIFVRSDSPLASLDDLQADVESRPGQVKASGTAFGGIWHVALAGWLNSRGIDPTAATWISINGAGPSLQELNASGVDFVCCSLPEADALLASKLVRCLGVMADERVPGFLDVPTFREQGHDWSIAGWRGIAAPKAIAADRLQVLVDALQEIAESDDYLQFMANAGFNVSLEGPDAFAATLKRQDEQFNEVLTGPAFAAISDEHFGPMLFPAVTALLLVLSIASVLWTSNTSPTETAANPAHFGKIGLVLCAAIFYLFVSEWLGFILAATIMLAALMALFRVRLAIALPFATALSLCVYQVFAVGLRVPLPRGILGW